MEYYDGMGNNKTQYVLELERRIKELEQLNNQQTIKYVPITEIECGTANLDFVTKEKPPKKGRKKMCQ